MSGFSENKFKKNQIKTVEKLGKKNFYTRKTQKLTKSNQTKLYMGEGLTMLNYPILFLIIQFFNLTIPIILYSSIKNIANFYLALSVIITIILPLQCLKVGKRNILVWKKYLDAVRIITLKNWTRFT